MLLCNLWDFLLFKIFKHINTAAFIEPFSKPKLQLRYYFDSSGNHKITAFKYKFDFQSTLNWSIEGKRQNGLLFNIFQLLVHFLYFLCYLYILLHQFLVVLLNHLLLLLFVHHTFLQAMTEKSIEKPHNSAKEHQELQKTPTNALLLSAHRIGKK